MIIHDVTQGSDQWLVLRAKYFCASEAPVMMGASKYQTRDQLLKDKKFGKSTQEVDPHKLALFERGHAAEAAIRPHVAELIGDELYPVTGSIDIDGLLLLASFDGLTMDHGIVFEHKLWSTDNAMRTGSNDLSMMHIWQIEHELLVSGAKAAIFVTSDGTPEKMKDCWYRSDPVRRAALIQGWKQFKKELESYKHVEAELVPTAKAIMELPALSIQLVGEVKTSNLAMYRETAFGFIRNINTDLKTDQDFADAEAMVKFCDGAEKELESAKKMALAQTSTIDELFRTVDLIKEEMRQKRLELDKLIKARKEAVRFEIHSEANQLLSDHVELLNKRLGKNYLPPAPNANFAEAMKSKKTITSLRSAVSAELVRAKIEASLLADRIEINLNALDDLGANHGFLFADLPSLVTKANDDFIALVKVRITEHDAKEEKRLNAQREQIRKEEQQKAQADELATRDKILMEKLDTRVMTAPPQRSAGILRQRPTDVEMVFALSQYYDVEATVIIEWLANMNITNLVINQERDIK